MGGSGWGVSFIHSGYPILATGTPLLLWILLRQSVYCRALEAYPMSGSLGGYFHPFAAPGACFWNPGRCRASLFCFCRSRKETVTSRGLAGGWFKLVGPPGEVAKPRMPSRFSSLSWDQLDLEWLIWDNKSGTSSWPDGRVRLRGEFYPFGLPHISYWNPTIIMNSFKAIRILPGSGSVPHVWFPWGLLPSPNDPAKTPKRARAAMTVVLSRTQQGQKLGRPVSRQRWMPW